MSGVANRVNAFWYKGSLGDRERLCLGSFVRHGYDLDLYTYDDGLAAPDGVNVRSASTIIPEDEVFFYDDDFVVGKVSAFSNLFRYAVLAARGGWWIDTDVICLRRLPERDGFIAGFEQEGVVNSAVMFSPPGTALMSDAAKECRAIGKKAQWGDAGPQLITRMINLHGLFDAVLPVTDFYPINWDEAVAMLLLPEKANTARQRCSSSHTLHLWNEMFGRAGVSKAAIPPVGSFLYQLFGEAGFDTSGKEVLDPEFVRTKLATKQCI